MIDFDFSHECCGCSACIDVCPKHCIQQTTNKSGFIVPEVNKSICIDCHLCEKVCPELNPERIEFQDRKMYSAVNKNEEQRSAGSSGSIFYLLAEKTISEGGIVFGAAFDENLQLRHASAEGIEELRPLLKSKYLQSNTQGVYKLVKEQLKSGRKVLFVGTPCQCNALYKFLGSKKPENLLIVDFICHGVPSQDLFNKSISYWEKKHNCKIVQFEFRRKRPDCVHSFYIKAKEMTTGAHHFEFSGRYEKFPFYSAFKRHICYRGSCYECKFATTDRVSDLTLGDFWHLEELDNSISLEEFNKGYSMVLVNSKKGFYVLDFIKNMVRMKEFSIQYACKYNYAYIHPTRKNFVNNCFFYLYNLPFGLLDKLFMADNMPFVRKVVRAIGFQLIKIKMK